MADKTRGWVIAGSIASIVAAVWIVLSPPGLWQQYENGRLSGLVAALAWLLPVLGLVGAALKWRGRWGRWLRERYVSAVCRAARPVSGDVARKLLAGPEEGEQDDLLALKTGVVPHHEPRTHYGLSQRVGDLGVEALHVLLSALRQYDASESERVVVTLSDVELEWGHARVEPSLPAMAKGLEQLERAGFVESWRDWEFEGRMEGFQVTLGERSVPRRVAREISWLVERELVKRGVWEQV